MKNQKKAIVLGLTASMLMPVCFNSGTAEAAAADTDVAAMQAEINDLTARLTDLENSLATAKEKQEAAKSEKKAKKEAPTIKWSGSTKSGYMYNEEKTGKIKAEASILARTVVDKTYDVGIGLKFKATSSEPKDGYSSEKNKVKLTDSYVGRSFGPVYVRAGVQKVSIGEGLWLSKSSVNQFTANYKMTPRDALYLGYGRDSQDYLANDTNKRYAPPTRTRLLKFAQYQHDFSKDAYAGLYVGTQQPERYFGIYGSTPIVGKFGITAEYVRNTNKDKPALVKDEFDADNGYGYKYFGADKNTQGYVISLNYGKAKKKGTWDIIGQYLNVDQNLFMDDGYSSWKDYIDAAGFKGFGLIMDYATSDHSKLSLLRYWAHTNPDGDNLKGGTKAPLEKSPHYSTYLKFTTKF
ncbi:hypothetical protein [uncultured Mitsuokella sp.]|uniref:hypothetical protein n=1 Tax=uncultured Mitsuokella sp. TaxID=453120 RepID=UPI0025949F78|nr:hypothetical protein [uncultured Mitsuokella sp.]